MEPDERPAPTRNFWIWFVAWTAILVTLLVRGAFSRIWLRLLAALLLLLWLRHRYWPNPYRSED